MSLGSKFNLVYYYVPEDKDDPETPNAFGISLQIDEIKVGDIKKNFPLEGEYYFRFKCKVNGAAVWLDIPEEGEKPPQFQNRIMMKVIRKSWGGDPLLDKLEETKIHIPERAHTHPVPVTGPTPKANEFSAATMDVDFLDQRHKVHSANTTPIKARKSSNLVDFDDVAHPPPAAKPKNPVTANLIEF